MLMILIHEHRERYNFFFFFVERITSQWPGENCKRRDKEWTMETQQAWPRLANMRGLFCFGHFGLDVKVYKRYVSIAHLKARLAHQLLNSMGDILCYVQAHIKLSRPMGDGSLLQILHICDIADILIVQLVLIFFFFFFNDGRIRVQNLDPSYLNCRQ